MVLIDTKEGAQYGNGDVTHLGGQNGNVIMFPPGDEKEVNGNVVNGGLDDLGGTKGKEDVEQVQFEDLLKICGEAGRWQFQVFLLASFVGFCTAIHNLVYAFIGAIPDHWCELDRVPGLTHDQIKELAIPKNSKGDFVSCERYTNVNYTSGDTLANPNTAECDAIEYDLSEFDSTIVTEWDLVCGDTFWASSVQAMYMLGILAGSPLLGAMSDKFGRKKAILISTIIFILAGPSVALAPIFPLLMLARFILGASSPGIYGTSFVLAIEVLGPDWRGAAGTLFCLPFALGYMVLPGVAYFIRDWRHLQLVFCIPNLFLIVTWWLLPESPRWLLRKGKLQEAEALLRKAAVTNGRGSYIPNNFTELVHKVGALEKEKTNKITMKRKIQSFFAGYWKLLRTPRMRVRTLTIYVSWASISMIYYGLSLNSPNLATDRYLYVFISGVLEIPSYLMMPPLIRYIGRRPVFSGFLLICGAALLSSLLFHEDSAVVVVIALFGKLIIGGAYALVYLYATELFPTLLRTYGLGTASMVGRLGSVAAPYVVDILGKNQQSYPIITFGIVSLVAGCLSLLLPETLNRRLPDTVKDVEKSS